MTCGLVHASYSLNKWQAVKLTFFAPRIRHLLTIVSDAPLAPGLFPPHTLEKLTVFGKAARILRVPITLDIEQTSAFLCHFAFLQRKYLSVNRFTVIVSVFFRFLYFLRVVYAGFFLGQTVYYVLLTINLRVCSAL